MANILIDRELLQCAQWMDRARHGTMRAMNWLFLKGLARGQVHWDRQPAIFEERVAGAKVLMLDLPGIGEARDRPAPWKVGEIVEDLRERWLILRESSEALPNEPWSILAISLGGMILMEWVTRYPEDFERGVALVPSAANVSPPWKRLLLSTGPNYMRAVFAMNFSERERRVLAIVTNDDVRREELVAMNTKLAEVCPIPIPVANRQLTAATRWRAPAQLPIPVLFLGSFADHMVHPECTPVLAQRFDAPYRMHETAGHEIPHDDPWWVADRVAEWLAES